MIMFGALALLIGVRRPLSILQRPFALFASYSYSLYLLHNTILIVVLERVSGDRMWLKVILGVIAAHLCAIALYLVAGIPAP